MKYCPRCLRTEAELDTCPNEDFPGMKCPEPVAEDPTKDVTLACGPCGFTRVVPVKELISGTAKNKLPSCRRDDCACVVVPPEATEQVFKPYALGAERDLGTPETEIETAEMPEVKPARAQKVFKPKPTE